MQALVTVSALLVFLVPRLALATTQFSEILYMDAQKHSLVSLPLEQYYGPANPRPKFRAPNTATWRGYIGTWEIKGGVLYLKAIQAWTEKGEMGLEALFPGQKAPIPATWFSGQLRVPQGKVLKPGVPQPLHERDLMITVEKGRVTGKKIIDNTGRVGPPKR
jgi:hypothetical protein